MWFVLVGNVFLNSFSLLPKSSTFVPNSGPRVRKFHFATGSGEREWVLDTLPRSRSPQTKMAAAPSKLTGLENPTEK